MPEAHRQLRIGVDFDNTLVRYDELLRAILREADWLPEDELGGKREVRDALRRLPDGESRWRELQAAAYGRRIMEAVPIEGARDFLTVARQTGAAVFVVSHKTKTAAADPNGVDLREAARSWLEANGFFDEPVSLDRSAVYFEASRAGKLKRIGDLACTHFVDDLEETYLEPAFPTGVVRVLYSPQGGATEAGNVTVCRTWNEIGELVLCA